MTETTVFETAKALADRGFSVIPIERGTKKAAVPWAEYQQKRTGGAQLQLWFGSGKYTPAVVTGAISGVVVVDCDSAEALAYARERLPQPWMRVLTGVKEDGFRGEHWYYQHPGVPVRNTARIKTDRGQLALDLRGDGGYVLAPGSEHPSGVRYELAEEGPPTPFDPAWITPEKPKPARQPARESKSRAPSGSLSRAAAWLQKRDPAIEGNGGNQHTFATACDLVIGFGLPVEQALELLRDWNAICSPPWEESELREIVEHARQYGRGEPGYLLNAERTPVGPAPTVSDQHLAISAAPEDPFGAQQDFPGDIAPEAFHGLLGEIAREAGEFTEADTRGILVEMLARFGHMVGHGPHYMHGYVRHPAALWPILVGATGDGKGSGTASCDYYCNLAFPDPEEPCRCKASEAFGSGEALVQLLANEAGESREVARDRQRIFCRSSEFSGFLVVCSRTGSILSQKVREAWDHIPLSTRKTGAHSLATNYHVTIYGHLTPSDLAVHGKASEMRNGFLNRFLPICVRRQKLLPVPPKPYYQRSLEISHRLREAVLWARDLEDWGLDWTREARLRWDEVYEEFRLDTQEPGLVTDMCARNFAQIVRMAMIYALADRSRTIDTPHLEAARAVWVYAQDSIRYLFSSLLEENTQNRILGALRTKWPEPMTKSEIFDLFSRNQGIATLNPDLHELARRGLIAEITLPSTGGRPPKAYRALTPEETSFFFRLSSKPKSQKKAPVSPIYIKERTKEEVPCIEPSGTNGALRITKEERSPPEQPSSHRCPSTGCSNYVRNSEPGRLCAVCQRQREMEEAGPVMEDIF